MPINASPVKKIAFRNGPKSVRNALISRPVTGINTSPSVTDSGAGIVGSGVDVNMGGVVGTDGGGSVGPVGGVVAVGVGVDVGGGGASQSLNCSSADRLST